MFKCIGLILTVLTGAAVGFRASERLRFRYKKLLKYYVYIGELSDRMRTGVELERLFCDEKAAELISADGYRITLKRDGLNSGDIELLEEFFKALGMGDIEAQTARTATYRELLGTRVSDAEQDMRSKSRLYSLIGLFSGIFTAIIFM